MEEAGILIRELLDSEHDGFALTSHNYNIEGWHDLWMSTEVAEYLVETTGMVLKHNLFSTENVRGG